MAAPLYNTEILRLAASTPTRRLATPMASVEKRSPVCGSRVTVDVETDADGRVTDIGMLVRACALGQASSTLFARHAVGRSPEELAVARDALTRWLAGEIGDDMLTKLERWANTPAHVTIPFLQDTEQQLLKEIE